MPSPKDIKKLMNVAKGAKPASKAADLDEVMGRLPKIDPALQAKIDAELNEIRRRQREAYNVPQLPKEKGKKALAEARRILMTPEERAASEAQFREQGLQSFLEPSAIKERLYHGTSRPDLTEFKTGKMIKEKQYPGNTIEPWAVDNRDAVFLTPDPQFSSRYSGGDWEVSGGYTPTTYPVRVQVKNPWDYENPDHIEGVIQAYKEKYPLRRDKSGAVPSEESLRHHWFEKNVRELPLRERDNWSGVEKADLQEIIRSLGHDAFFVKEAGIKNLGVYDPRKIKSAIGNQGTYDIENPDITKAEGGLAMAGGGGKLGKALKAARGAEKAVESGKDLQSMVEAARPLTAAERAMAGKLMTEYIAAQPVTRLSEALGNVGAEGKKLRITQSDRTAAKYLGGPPFSGLQLVDPNYAEARATWGVKTPTAAKIITNQTSPDILWSTLIGSPFQHRSNELIFDKLYKAFQKSAKEGNLSEELRAKFNAALEPHFGEGADILDPKLRKEINTFEERGIVGDLLLGKELGGALRGGSIIPGGKIMMESTEPMLQGVKTFSVGPRLFTLDKGVISRPDMHPAFPEIMQGEDLRQLFTPVPNEIALPTFHEEFRRRTGGKKKPGYYELTMTPKGDPYPTQDITEKYLTHLQREGYADGGGVHMQGGGDPGDVSGEMFKPKPLEIPSIFKDAAAALKAQFEKERRSMRKPGAVQDVIMRGPVAFGMGAPMDIVGMGGELLDYAQTKIPALRKPASVMDTGPEKKPTMGYAPRVSLAPEGPYGTEAAQELLGKAGLTTGEERPLFELGAGVISPAVVTGGYKVGKALAPTAREMLEAGLERAVEPTRMYAAPPGKPGKVKAPANPVGFYNPAEKAALNLQRKQGPGSAFISDMKKLEQGVNDERIAELGLDQLASKPNVTRDEVMALAEQNRIPLRESVRRPYQESDEYSETADALKESIRYREGGIQQVQAELDRVRQTAPTSPLVQQYENKIETMRQSIARDRERLEGKKPSLYGPDSHPDYNMPGGENYREIRVGLPEQRAASPSMEGFVVETKNENKFTGQRDILIRDPQGNIVSNRYGFRGDDAQALRDEATSRARDAGKEDNFYHRTHHGDEPNVLFHLRVADHTDVDGKRGLLIDELQSDWHQKGREKGYAKERDLAYQPSPEGYEPHPYNGKPGFNFIDRSSGDMYTGYGNTIEEAKADLKNSLGKRPGVPDAPFKDNWYQLGLKRAIKEAADNGMDRVYLTTGARQADRYDLSKQIGALSVKPKPNGMVSINASKDGEVVIMKEVPKDQLADYVGKDMAKKAISDMDAGKDAIYSGLDLKVGGEGMKQYYDKTYKNFLEKYAKQHGGKLGETRLPGAALTRDQLSARDIENMMDNPEFKKILDEEFVRVANEPPVTGKVEPYGNGNFKIEWSDGTVMGGYSEESARSRLALGRSRPTGETKAWNAALKRFSAEPVYYIDLTDAMRNSAKKGQSYKAGGAVTMAEGGAVDYESRFNEMLQNHIGMAEGGAVDYESAFNKMLQAHVGMADGGEVNRYNEDPDTSDGGLFVAAPAFKNGGAVKSIWTVN